MNLECISVIVTTYNEACNIERCLASVSGFGEIVMVDSFSTDATVEIARRHPTTTYVRPYESAADQKNWAMGVVRNDWVLIVDADEEVTGALRGEIEALDPRGVDGYWIRRTSVYLGRRIKGCGWQRDKVLRLFDRRRGRYTPVSVHEEVSLAGPASMLCERLAHYPYRDVAQHLRKINEYSTRGARDLAARKVRWPLARALVHAPLRLARMYVWQRGFRDGAQGFILCLLSAYSVFLKYAKAWELSRRRMR
jgi:glycosyltransferase involved in cell wall biosynthesis